MNDKIIHEGQTYVAAHQAAVISGFTRVYIARLCREKKIKARRVGTIKYIRQMILLTLFFLPPEPFL